MVMLVWRIFMVVVAIVLLVLVVWAVTRTATSARKQVDTIRHMSAKAEPDITDAEYEDIHNEQPKNKNSPDDQHGK